MKRTQIQPKTPTQAEREMYERYVAYFDSGQSPYGGLAPLPFFMWFKLPANQRPGGPAIEVRAARMEWQANDIVWVTKPS